MINISNEQKIFLNEHGVMVSEFKLWCNKIKDYICDVWKAIMVYIIEVENEIKKVFVPIIDSLNELAEKASYFKEETFEYYEEKVNVAEIINIQNMKAKQRYRYCITNGYPYQLFIKKQYHCRNNC